MVQGLHIGTNLSTGMILTKSEYLQQQVELVRKTPAYPPSLCADFPCNHLYPSR